MTTPKPKSPKNNRVEPRWVIDQSISPVPLPAGWKYVLGWIEEDGLVHFESYPLVALVRTYEETYVNGNLRPTPRRDRVYHWRVAEIDDCHWLSLPGDEGYDNVLSPEERVPETCKPEDVPNKWTLSVQWPTKSTKPKKPKKKPPPLLS